MAMLAHKTFPHLMASNNLEKILQNQHLPLPPDCVIRDRQAGLALAGGVRGHRGPPMFSHCVM